jgi:hypothetical protein
LFAIDRRRLRWRSNPFFHKRLPTWYGIESGPVAAHENGAGIRIFSVVEWAATSVYDEANKTSLDLLAGLSLEGLAWTATPYAEAGRRLDAQCGALVGT